MSLHCDVDAEQDLPEKQSMPNRKLKHKLFIILFALLIAVYFKYIFSHIHDVMS